MTLLDWIAVISLAIAIIFLLFIFLLMVGIIKANKEQRKLRLIRTRNKRKRKVIARKKRQLKKKKNKRIIGSFLCLLVTVLGATTSMYAIYYQSTNLSQEDKKVIVSGYYNLRDIEEQLQLAESGEGDRAEQNLDNLSLRLAAFALNKADYRINGEGQIRINRYYSSMKELGINLSSQSKGFYKDASLLESFRGDIERVKKNEQAVIKQFKINEKSLAEKK
ncbi:hypothetical protein [Enterococcus ureasiticus]|uniref:Uncharacterized protein n=1 Tax=Enterococcus ureasiticus TaxID=903984 RepID=A0A1E5GMQ9_9ENTE|nr:hypothetical protein [Enterococcus ureasiticus]OEG13984.1 hypothetical protein BCR21_03050 [Enterococcus ureasiticus]